VAKRKAIYGEMQEVVHNDGGGAIFAFPSNGNAHALSIGSNEPDAVGILCRYKIVQRARLA
jgi:hypothetical protein